MVYGVGRVFKEERGGEGEEKRGEEKGRRDGVRPHGGDPSPPGQQINREALGMLDPIWFHPISATTPPTSELGRVPTFKGI